MTNIISNDMKFLEIAGCIANNYSGCLKVKVGAIIVKDNKILGYGANRAIPDLCTSQRGCLRQEKFGENSKLHRNPTDCRAIHSEVDAICNSQSSIINSTIYITRYPCEACARAIISAGIRVVVYGRQQKISPETVELFERQNIEVIHVPEYMEEDTTI